MALHPNCNNVPKIQFDLLGPELEFLYVKETGGTESHMWTPECIYSSGNTFINAISERDLNI